jgi:hypothetical protein
METRKPLTYGNAVTYRLGNAHGINVADYAGPVFGHLAATAFHVLTAYHSDLYIDALWLTHNLSTTPFYWGVRTSGTNIGSRESDVDMSDNKVYRVTVSMDSRLFTCRMIMEEGRQS